MLAASKYADPYGMSTLIRQGFVEGCGWRLLVDGIAYDNKTFSEGDLDGIAEEVLHETYQGVDEANGNEWRIEFSDNPEDFGVVDDEDHIEFIDLYQEETGSFDVPLFAIYWGYYGTGERNECQVRAKTLNEAIGAFMVEHENMTCAEIFEHIEL